MNASDRLTRILSLLQDVSKIMDVNRELAADDWLSLSNLSIRIDGLEVKKDKFKLWLQQLTLEASDKAAIKDLKEQLHTVCSRIADVYCNNIIQWPSQQHLFSLMEEKAMLEFAADTRKAEAAFKHISAIEKVFHEGARYVNSRERMEDVEKSIYARYASEIRRLTGRDVPPEEINAEYLHTKEEKAAADNDREDVKRKVQERFEQLCDTTNEYVLDDIYGFVYNILVALDGIGYPEPEKRRPGRPSRVEQYAAAGIVDFESCFTDPVYYRQVADAIEEKESYSISSNELKFIAQYLLNNTNKLKIALASLNELCGFIIAAFPDKFSITNSRSPYKALDPDKSVADGWKRKLMIKR